MSPEEIKQKALEQCLEGNCAFGIEHREDGSAEVQFVTIVDLPNQTQEEAL